MEMKTGKAYLWWEEKLNKYVLKVIAFGGTEDLHCLKTRMTNKLQLWCQFWSTDCLESCVEDDSQKPQQKIIPLSISIVNMEIGRQKGGMWYMWGMYLPPCFKVETIFIHISAEISLMKYNSFRDLTFQNAQHVACLWLMKEFSN